MYILQNKSSKKNVTDSRPVFVYVAVVIQHYFVYDDICFFLPFALFDFRLIIINRSSSGATRANRWDGENVLFKIS